MTSSVEPFVYLDYNATTPVDPEVVTELMPYLGGKEFGNPSSSHLKGRHAHTAVDMARGRVATLLGCDETSVFFTSGATESLNWAIKGAAFQQRKDSGRNHILISAVEHVCVFNIVKWLASEHGFDCEVCPVDSQGRVDPLKVKSLIRPGKTALVSIQHGNAEVGTVEPIAEIVAAVEEVDSNVVVHTDASQSAGKYPLSVESLGYPDLITLAGHKFYAPKGIGALVTPSGVTIEQLMHGGGQEFGERCGTENVPWIVGFGKACELVHNNLSVYMDHMSSLRRVLLEALKEAVTLEAGPTAWEMICVNTPLNDPTCPVLANTLSISVKGIQGADVVKELGDKVGISAGSACHSGEHVMSSVLKAMKVEPIWGLGTLRFSIGRMTTEEEVRRATRIVARVIAKHLSDGVEEDTFQ
ncbi:cysteine desulfurase, putative [Perkinsus marinus ATCC 50983]|uniref:Cysteine desulfurase, putative n=1 Tax=Perkinsus marinus (strain ATCC 50983 / TXsc) TaxID=423536 RepID=C5LNG7_PERM5|nr:cysteine desulfurase, putative [Perkinsus marinus ATCC 50983]EER01718.1 cysteine desulfurase, putative [Perkinsus marinus ATCC 50983]|eukprot:XP_002769000.1 cysteine desulfurase, putative [Perkinsus marinus ATCC 50983]